ncbi:hypothetical protein Q1695_002190 [Nippostrongylus brasiliensis]|nr:hypothetical protein Q1695_002190 [Nippostrongylus brasiliensis]
MFSLQQLTLRKIIVLLTLTASIMILSLPNLPWPGSEQDLGDSGLPRHAEQCVPFYDLISRESSKEEKEPTDSWKFPVRKCTAGIRMISNVFWVVLSSLSPIHCLSWARKPFSVQIAVLDDYVSSGEVEAIFLKQHWSNEDVYWMHISTIQDCIVRGRHHSSYVIMNDLDERIVPGNANESLVSLLLSTMERHKNVGLINFWSRFVFRTADLPSTYKGEKTLREHLPTLVFDNTTLTKAQRYHKCIVNTLRTFDMRIHRANAFFGNYTEVYVPMSTGYVRHYRNPSLGDFRTIILPIVEASGTFETIKYPEHLMGQLFQNIQRRLDCVYKKDLVINSTQPNC